MDAEFDVHFKKERNVWTATLKDPDPKGSIAGFGDTPDEALKDLFLEKDKEDYQKEVREDKS